MLLEEKKRDGKPGVTNTQRALATTVANFQGRFTVQAVPWPGASIPNFITLRCSRPTYFQLFSYHVDSTGLSHSIYIKAKGKSRPVKHKDSITEEDKVRLNESFADILTCDDTRLLVLLFLQYHKAFRSQAEEVRCLRS